MQMPLMTQLPAKPAAEGVVILGIATMAFPLFLAVGMFAVHAAHTIH